MVPSRTPRVIKSLHRLLRIDPLGAPDRPVPSFAIAVPIIAAASMVAAVSTEAHHLGVLNLTLLLAEVFPSRVPEGVEIAVVIG